MAHRRRLRPWPTAGLAIIAALGVAALAYLVFSGVPATAATVIGAAVAVCGCAGSAFVFLLPRLHEQGTILDNAQVAALPVVTPTGKLPAVVRGRDAEFAHLRRVLRTLPGDFAVLAGMAGVGKSTIATAFVNEIRQGRAGRRRIDVWFASAADPASLAGTLATVARELGGNQADVEAIGTGKTDGPDRLWRLLQASSRRWVLVLDNADDPAVLARPVPMQVSPGPGRGRPAGTPADGTGWVRSTSCGLVVITSRSGDPSSWGRHAQIIRVRPLAPADAAQVLLDQAPHAGGASEAQALAQRLDGLPLALSVAGTYLSSASASVTSFRDYGSELMLAREPGLSAASASREVPMRTFEISLDDLDRKGLPQARPLLRLLSLYASPTPIPRGLLNPGRLRPLLTPDSQEDARHGLELVLQGLGRLSLIDFAQTDRTVPGGRDLVVHPAIADTSREHLRESRDKAAKAALTYDLAADLLVDAIGTLDQQEPGDWPAYVRYGPHLHALIGNAEFCLDPAHLRELLWAVITTALAHYGYGAYDESVRFARVVLERLSLLTADDLGSLRTLHEAAWFPAILRQHSRAETIYREVLSARTRLLGPAHPDTLCTRHELAWLAACKGRWADAEAGYRKVLPERSRVLGAGHPDTLITRHELGWAIANQGRAGEAERLLTEVLSARRIAFSDPDHPRTLWTRHELAWAIGYQGRWPEAEKILLEILLARRRVLRAEHPDLLTTVAELAWVVAAQGRQVEALRLYQETFEGRRVILGPDHPDTLATAQAIERLRNGQVTVPRHIA